MDLAKVHTLSARQLEREPITATDDAGCFHCEKVFKANSIREWVGKRKSTAICPHCGVDSVLIQKEVCGLTDTFEQLLEAMNYEYFRIFFAY